MSHSHWNQSQAPGPYLGGTAPSRSAEFVVDPLIDRFDFVFLIRRHWKLLVALPLICALIASLVHSSRERLYESSALLLVDSSLDDLLQFENVGKGGNSVQESLKSLEVALVADSVVLRVVDKLELRTAPGYLPSKLTSMPQLPDAKLLDFLRKNRIKASLQPETRLIKISAMDTNPERARLIASTFVEEFGEFLADQRRDEVKDVRKVIETQIVEAKKSALAAEEKLKEFRKSSSGLPMEQDHDLFAARLTQFGADLNEAVRNRVELEGTNASLQDLDPESSAMDIIEVSNYRADSHVSAMLTELANSRSRLAAAEQQYTKSHPARLSAEAEVERNQQQLKELARDIVSTVSARYDAAVKREELLRKELSTLQNDLVDVKAESSEFRALKEEAENRWLHLKTLEARLSENLISTEMPGNIATEVSKPLTPYSVTGPSLIIFAAAGVLLGCFLNFGFLAFKILAGLPFSSRRQLEERFRLPVIADWSASSGASSHALPSTEAMIPYLFGHPSKTIQVSAPGLNGFGEQVAGNLAQALTSQGQKVLFVFVTPGVGEPQIHQTRIPGLSRLDIGSDDIFDATRFISVLPKLQEKYDKIIIEAGSIDNPALVEWIASFSDREIVVVGKGTIPKSEVANRIRRVSPEDPSRVGMIFVEPKARGRKPSNNGPQIGFPGARQY